MILCTSVDSAELFFAKFDSTSTSHQLNPLLKNANYSYLSTELYSTTYLIIW